ncbi:hypothetical protein [Pendulispora albinea]|uniref:Uncharacterized protein n=1 Tax=Pendulispora albinea TaxID=2741071 RepID=A0ABZ2LSJ4_9BACT
MMQPYLIAGVFGVLLTVAFYEGRSALNRSSHPGPRSEEAARRDGACETDDSARQEIADSLMRCQDRLAQREALTSTASAPDEAPAILPPSPPPYEGDRFDPTTDEWKKLAEEGRVKLSRPCTMAEGWVPSEDELRTVGLGPNDAQAIADVYKAATARSWEETQKHCAEWLGVDHRVVERIGAAMCESMLDVAAQKDEGVFRRVAEVRAGRRSETNLPPVERYYLARTKELKEFESDLAKRVGTDATRKITESTTFCMYREVWPELGR